MLGLDRRGMRLRRHRSLRLAPAGVLRERPRYGEHLGRGEREQNPLGRRPFAAAAAAAAAAVELGRGTAAASVAVANVHDGRAPSLDPRAAVGFTLTVGLELLLPPLLLEPTVLLLCLGRFSSHCHPSSLLLAHRRYCVVAARRTSKP